MGAGERGAGDMTAITFINLRDLSGGSAAIEPNSLIDCGGGVQIAGHGAGSGTAAISRTTDNWATTETTVQTWTEHARCKLHRRPSGRILALVNGGTGGVEIWLSDNIGVTWTLAQELLASTHDTGGQPNQPWSKSTSGFLCVMVWDRIVPVPVRDVAAFWTSSDDGSTWAQAAYTFGPASNEGQGAICLETLSASVAIFGTAKVGTLPTVDIYRTTDNFATATSVFNATDGNFVSLLMLGNGNILAGSRGGVVDGGPKIRRSTDVGATWAQLSDLTALVGSSGEPTVLSVLSSGVVGLGGQVTPATKAIGATSEDGGATWTRDDNTLSTLNASTVLTAIIRADNGFVYGGGWSGDVIYRAPWVFSKGQARGLIL